MKTIVIADDEENLRLLVSTTLEDPGLRILEASDGVEALELVRTNNPDLVLLDWMMPVKSGLEALMDLKADEATAAIPVILLTAKVQAEDRERALQAGAHSFLGKPFSPLELMDLVRGIVGE